MIRCCKNLIEVDFTQCIFENLESFKNFLVHPHISNLEILNLSYTKIDDETLTILK